jgi:hypothetical protein
VAANKLSNVEYVNGFLDLCQADFGSDLIADKLKWAQIMHQIFYDGEPCSDVDYLARFCDERWSDIELVSENLLSDLYEILENCKSELRIKIMQPADITCEEGHFRFGYLLDYLEDPFYKNSLFKEIEIEIWDPHEDERDNPLDRKQMNRAFLTLFKKLDGFSIESIRRCPQCNRLFFNASKRSKTYCSSRCQNTAAVTRLRKREGKSGH